MKRLKQFGKKIIAILALPEYLWKYRIHRKWKL